MAVYRTIVADPPWDVRRSSGYAWRKGRASGERMAMPCETMQDAEIAALPVTTLAERDAHLYLWTIQSKLREAYYVAEAWGFHTICALVWCKGAAGVPGGTYCSTTEFVLFCRRGTLPSKRRISRQWFTWARGEHSAKPEAFMDMVEQVSPGPYLELFARRQRLGWDTWGDEALNHGGKKLAPLSTVSPPPRCAQRPRSVSATVADVRDYTPQLWREVLVALEAGPHSSRELAVPSGVLRAMAADGRIALDPDRFPDEHVPGNPLIARLPGDTREWSGWKRWNL